MIIITDNIKFAERILSDRLDWQIVQLSTVDQNIGALAFKLMPQKIIYQATIESNYLWQYLFIVGQAAKSQFDVLVDVSCEDLSLPHGILCIAGSGRKFHGFKNRPWVSLAGNIHLSVFLAPNQEIENFGVAFTILSAVSVLQTLDSIDNLTNKAMVKWVNDILVGNAKVCGVLARTQSQGKIVTGAFMGIGLNVETKPKVQPTPFVPEVTSLCDFLNNTKFCNQSIAFHRLIRYLDQNYLTLLKGDFSTLLNFYRQRSLVIGKEVTIFSDEPVKKMKEMAHGKVNSIGDNLELILEGIHSPVLKGRLVLETERQ